MGHGDPEICRDGLLDEDRSPKPLQRKVYLLQRKAQKMGRILVRLQDGYTGQL